MIFIVIDVFFICEFFYKFIYLGNLNVKFVDGWFVGCMFEYVDIMWFNVVCGYFIIWVEYKNKVLSCVFVVVFVD